jgi:hypothetical protein
MLDNYQSDFIRLSAANLGRTDNQSRAQFRFFHKRAVWYFVFQIVLQQTARGRGRELEKEQNARM